MLTHTQTSPGLRAGWTVFGNTNIPKGQKGRSNIGKFYWDGSGKDTAVMKVRMVCRCFMEQRASAGCIYSVSSTGKLKGIRQNYQGAASSPRAASSNQASMQRVNHHQVHKWTGRMHRVPAQQKPARQAGLPPAQETPGPLTSSSAFDPQSPPVCALAGACGRHFHAEPCGPPASC